MGRAVVPAVNDSTPPTAPTNLTATGALGRATLGWTAATDDTVLARYNVHRSTTAGFTPSAANRIAQPTGTSYVDTTAPAGTHFYKVTAEDAAGNVGPASNEASAVVTADTTAPTVSITAPTDGATVSGTVSLAASAGDDVAVASVQFKLDGNNLGSADTSAPYSFNWDSLSTNEGPHTLTAVATDGAGNQRTSAPVAVTVTQPPVDTSGLVAGFGFEEGTGASVDDKSSSNNDGSINGAAWSDGGKYGKALSFDGVNDRIDIPDAASLDLSTEMTLEAWVKPSQLAGWRTVILKEGGGGQVYGMYGSAWGDHPSGHVNPGTEQWTQAPASLPVNSWSHLALTYNGTVARLYVDGAQVSQANISGGPIQTSTGALRIGGNAPWGEYFHGLIDEVRIYNRALSAAEIQADRDTAI
jgi:hypothetical protein